MKRFGQVIRLKPDKAGEYIRYHKEVWPAVLRMIKQCYISNYSIFFKDNWLFAYFEYTGNNFDNDIARMAADKLTQKWWEVVKPLMDPLESRQTDEFWADMEEIFHTD
jgi:L-rhamnose mutarotase